MDSERTHPETSPSPDILNAPSPVARRQRRAIHDVGAIHAIHAIPEHLLHGPARWALVSVAHLGNVTAFHPLGKDPDIFRLWIEPLAQVRSGHDGFVYLDDWRERWRDYLRQLR